MIVLSVSASDKNDSYKRENLKGKVKSVTRTDYTRWTKNGVSGDSLSWTSTYKTTYNLEGKPIENSSYNKNGGSRNSDTIPYDLNGNRLHTLRGFKNGKYSQKIIYAYNALGDKTQEKEYNIDDSLVGYTLYKYNESRNCIESRRLDKNDNIRGITIFEYDSAGNNTVERSLIKWDSSLNKKTTYRYNTEGLVIERKIYYAKDSLHLTYISTYNKNGDKIDSRAYDGLGKSVKQFSQTYYYVYDKIRNWKKQTTKSDGRVVHICTRKIEYY
ncbi:MAG TPA: hypothetical protein VK154_19930 [Chitinophagales bacterium]|nr:hypothetical protein [Chitinophagales bacterium]